MFFVSLFITFGYFDRLHICHKFVTPTQLGNSICAVTLSCFGVTVWRR